MRFFEAEPSGRASPSAMCRFAHATADGHCRTFGMSLKELRAQNRMWVLTRFRLQIDRYPESGEHLRVETWSSSRTNGIRGVREFEFFDASGEPLGRAASIFLMLDMTRRRPVRLPQLIFDLANPERSDEEEFETSRLTAPGNPNNQRHLNVWWKDLDANNHANNVSYVDWALEALPIEINRDRTLTQLDIEFLAEAFYGDDIISEVETRGEICSHQLKNSAGKLMALAVTQWK